MSPGARWIAGVVATLTGGVLAMVVLIVFAQRATAGRIVNDYYNRASRFDAEIATANASRALGWTATLTLSVDNARVCLLDRGGQPLTAHVELDAAHRTHPSLHVLAGGATGADGCAVVPMTLTAGVHDVIIIADAGDQHYVATAAREAR
ncbi:MAG: FixH family protein [Myxococcales bacterium]|nr:FixH family protein [Myxococcales bacterium]MBK7193730.1 FixH family protein [Myxococcales bacterium]MBP6844800.1 FixH family protein [Kofleriaceae bacterium]